MAGLVFSVNSEIPNVDVIDVIGVAFARATTNGMLETPLSVSVSRLRIVVRSMSTPLLMEFIMSDTC
ncbi:hypothetical protein ACPXCG_10150 [Gordonia sp. DT218]|uniref:hypothetical protein n=1 Tax=unclassified Gordonia (in: high G+C Gram-positive bacteria) TaxID=2657482 RepID=UPI003CE82CD8